MPRRNRTTRTRRTQTAKILRLDAMIGRAVATLPGVVTTTGVTRFIHTGGK